MFRNNLFFALRRLYRNRLATSINILGLALGLAVVIFIWRYITEETSYEQCHDHAQQIFLLERSYDFNQKQYSNKRTPPILAKLLKDNFPQIANATTVRQEEFETRTTERYANDMDYLFVDSTFARMFDLRFIHPMDPEWFPDPYQVLLSTAAAHRLFGTSLPIGEPLQVDIRGTEYTVTVAGVYSGFGGRTTLQSDAILPLSLLTTVRYPGPETLWKSFLYETYVQTTDHTDLADLAPRVQAFINAHLEYKYGTNQRYDFINIGDLYLTDAKRRQLFIYGSVDGFILLTCLINFVLLTTAAGFERNQEIGVRKLVGANRTQVLAQIFLENGILVTIALVLALAVAQVLVRVTGGHFIPEMDPALPAQPRFFLGIGVLYLVTTCSAGFSAAVFLNRFQPLDVISRRQYHLASGSFLRRILITTQLMLFTGLVFAAVILQGQTRYLRTTDLGYDPENILIIDLPSKAKQFAHYRVFKQSVVNYSHVLGVSATTTLPMDVNGGGSVWPKPSDPSTTVDLETFAVDYDFIETMGFRVVDGRSFSPAYADRAKTAKSPFTKLMLNKLAVRELGLKEPLGPLLNFGYVVEVVDDFYSHSLRDVMRPAVFFLTEQNVNYIVVKISGEDIPGTMTFLRDQWREVYPGYPFTVQFSDNRIARLYRLDTRFARMITGLTGIEVFIAAIGLFGLAMFIVNARLKEIGIRKVMGACFWDIVHLLSGEFGLMVGVAAIAGLPVSYYCMYRWLENFAYHITMTQVPFLLSIGLSLAILMLTAGYPALLAYTKNPTEMLVSE